MQINRINTYTNSNKNNKQKMNTTDPSFGKLLDSNFAHMAVNEIKAIGNTSSVIKGFAKDCNILIRSGLTMIEHGHGGKRGSTWAEHRPVKCYEITFSELGSENKSEWKKLREFFTNKVEGFPELSKPTVQGSKDDVKAVNELEEILVNAIVEGKAKYRKAFKLDEKDAINEARAKMAESGGATISLNSKKRTMRK